MRWLPYVVGFSWILGCGSTVEDGRSGGTTGAGGDPSASSSVGSVSSSGVGGAGGGFITVTSSGVGGAAQGTHCVTIPREDLYFVQVTRLGSRTILREPCPEDSPAPEPTARASLGGKCAGGVFLHACGVPAGPDPAEAFRVFAPLTGEGTTDLGSGELSPGNQAFSSLSITVDAFGEIGHPVTGSYAGTVLDPNGSTTKVSGAFSLCRVEDLPPCP
jgi:hypothetical protein